MDKSSGILPLLLPLLAVAACAADAPPAGPLTTVTKVTDGGFDSPTDAVSSPDGKTFYFAARTDQGQPALFVVASEPGSSAEVLATGDELVAPSGLVLSCEGATLYVADGGDAGGGALYSVDVATGALGRLPATGIGEASGLAMAPDCTTLHVTGHTPEGDPALFALPATGGDATALSVGAPLTDPMGVHVDGALVSWVMDYSGSAGALYAVPADGGAASVVLDGLTIGAPGSVSLLSVGGTAVIPTLDADGVTQLTTVVIETGEMAQLSAPEILGPGGVRTARDAPVLAVVDAVGAAIFRVE